MIRVPKILILDNDKPHAEDVRDMLSAITADQWAAYGCEPFMLGAEDIKVSTESSSFVEAWKTERRCDWDLVICDLHMGEREGEGARAVLSTLRDIKSPPFLLVMTQFHAGVFDEQCRRLEREALEASNPVPYFVTAKHKEMTDVSDRSLQLDRTHWRNLVIRVIASRSNRGSLRRLQRESSLWKQVGALPAVKSALQEVAAVNNSKVVLMIGERNGLQRPLARSLSNDEVQWRAQVRPDRFVDTFIASNAPWSLGALEPLCAVAVAEAEDLLAAPGGTGGPDIAEQIGLLHEGRLLEPLAGADRFHPFHGRLILCVTDEFDTSMRDRPEGPSSLYGRLEKVHLPSYRKLRKQMLEAGRDPSPARQNLDGLIDFVLKADDVSVTPFDRLVMIAYDWDLGVRGSHNGIEALRAFVEALKLHVEGGQVPPGHVVGQLTQTEAGRRSILAGLECDGLLCLIISRLHQSYKADATLQAAAFMYARELGLGGPCELRSKFLNRFWKQKGAFAQLKSKHEFSTLTVGEWPTTIAEGALYKAKWGESTKPSPMAEAMKQWLDKETQDACATPKNALWAQIAATRARMKGTGSPTGAHVEIVRQLQVLDQPFEA